MMKLSSMGLAAAFVLFAAAAQAHTHLKDSVPAEGSTVSVSPPNIVLKFSEASRLTALTVKAEGGAEQKLAPLPTTPAAEVTVRAPMLAPGKYVVTWRAMSGDSHIMSGELHFTISADGKKSTS
jgi:methionine-rich copper-binding protein CopC